MPRVQQTGLKPTHKLVQAYYAALAQGTRLAGDIHNSTLVVFPGVGHSPHLEAPGMVLSRLLHFLGKDKGATRLPAGSY